MSSGDNDSCSSLFPHTPVLWVSPDAIQGHRSAANHIEIDLELKDLRAGYSGEKMRLKSENLADNFLLPNY